MRVLYQYFSCLTVMILVYSQSVWADEARTLPADEVRLVYEIYKELIESNTRTCRPFFETPGPG
jgi:hypothetical protein